MGDRDDWENLPIELLELIVQRLELLKDVIKFAVVCKSWKSAASVLEKEKTWLPSKHHPWLLLAEDTGFDLNALKFSKSDPLLSEMPYVSNSTRGLFSLSKQKVYNLELPEATYKSIVGTSNGWLVTYGRDLVINLLHPLSRQQIQLPPLSPGDDCDLDNLAYFMFIKKIVMSSEVRTESALQLQDATPMMMAIYSDLAILGFARLGDESWTNFELDIAALDFHDIVYYREKFYAIDEQGTLYMCDTDNLQHVRKEKHYVNKISTSFPFKKERGYDDHTYYLIESLCESHIWVVLRFRKGQYFEEGPLIPGDFPYYTSDFKIFKLEVHYNDDVIPSYPSYTWSEEVKNLGNETLFIGRSSSISIASSEFIQPNSIYFTDDALGIFCVGGGNDMGIFNVETSKIQPHFQEASVHPFSPPLWYISK